MKGSAVDVAARGRDSAYSSFDFICALAIIFDAP